MELEELIEKLQLLELKLTLVVEHNGNQLKHLIIQQQQVKVYLQIQQVVHLL